jgi:hypothetical protein
MSVCMGCGSLTLRYFPVPADLLLSTKENLCGVTVVRSQAQRAQPGRKI